MAGAGKSRKVAIKPAKGDVAAESMPRTGSLPSAQPVTVQGVNLPPLTPELFINRELSWLEFNRRVLEEAIDSGNPLLERVKFAAIFASNLDEFFMIRVAAVKRKINAGIADPGPDGRTPIQQLAAIAVATQGLLDLHADTVRGVLVPSLGEAGIVVLRYEELTAAQRDALATVFEREIFPVLTPQAIDRGHRFPHVSNRSLNLIVTIKLPVGIRFARIKIPATLPRLVQVVGDREQADAGVAQFVWLEDVIRAHLGRLFPGTEVRAAYVFHVTRDSDIEIEELDDDDTDMVMSMRESIALRAFGPVVRLMIDALMPGDVRAWLMGQLHATDRDLYVIDGRLAAEDLFQLLALPRPDLKDAPFTPALVPALTAAPGTGEADIFAAIREQDILVHHPYQSFNAVSDFVRAASADPLVVGIKQTLYRIGKDSPLIPALIDARDDDTQVAVLVELKARFDEENNITWAEQLERHGVHVAYGLIGLKTHCKATLVVRREPEGLRRYVHLATGNYNASTARLYEDLGLFSAREDLGRDLSELFNALTGFAHQEHDFQKIWVAPGRLRDNFLEAIIAETRRHQEHGGGRLIFKSNALVDRTIIRALYLASQAGVKIDLIIRGACCLRPGVPGWSENIRVISVVGRFLEHSRIYYFGNGDEPRVLLGSADLMERNLDRRVEVIFPVEDPALSAEIHNEILGAYLRDTVNARELQPDGSYTPVTPAAGEAPFDAQTGFMDYHRPAVMQNPWVALR